MIPTELFDALSAVPDVSVRRREPLGLHVPLRLGGPADAWVSTFSTAALVEVLRLARKHTIAARIHWPFQDWIVREGGLGQLVVRPGGELERIALEDDVLWIGAAAPWSAAASLLSARGQPEIARWSGVPGALVEVAERAILRGLAVSIRRIKSGRPETVAIEDAIPEVAAPGVLLAVGLGRGRVKKGAPPRPATLFRDPDHDTAARVLVKAGVAGTRFRDWRLSAAEPGALVQLGEGTNEDLALLVKAVQHQVDRDRGVQLEVRIPTVGDRPVAERQRQRREVG